MILIYAEVASPRLLYITQFLFHELLGVESRISVDQEEYSAYVGPRINYSIQALPGIAIHPVMLLFEEDIKEQIIECFEVNGYKSFFKTTSSGFPFDIFAAAFYLLTRYEEYLPHEKDNYGRYAHENSLAFKEFFLQLPLINIWAIDLFNDLKNAFPEFDVYHSRFAILVTYDIDIAYSYLHKGLIRNSAGLLRELFSGKLAAARNRAGVLLHGKQDPFDTYAKLDQWHEQLQIKPIYFFLVPEKNGRYDKNILPQSEAMQKLTQRTAAKYVVGLHPSWQSADDLSLLKEEKTQLEAMVGKSVNISRQHYIRFELPAGYRHLISNGITDDYSMGYGSINGFRASVASSFFWYDLQLDKPTSLRIHPFCYMEANSFYEQHFTTAQAFDEMMYYLNICKRYKCEFISIFHNHFLGTDPLYAGWGDMYEIFLMTAFTN